MPFRGVGCHLLAIGRDVDNRRKRLIPILDAATDRLRQIQ